MFSAKFFLTIYVRVKLGNPVTVIISKLHLVDVLRPNATAIYLQTITMMLGKKQGHRLIHTPYSPCLHSASDYDSLI